MHIRITYNNFYIIGLNHLASLANRLLLLLVFFTLFLQQTAATKLFTPSGNLAKGNNYTLVHRHTAFKNVQSPIPLSPLADAQFFESETDDAEDDSFLSALQYSCFKEKHFGFTYSEIQQQLSLKSYLAQLKIGVHQRTFIPFFLLHQSWKGFIG